MAYDYIKRSYPFRPMIGRRVRHTETGRVGFITKEDIRRSHYVMVRFLNQKHASPCHPMTLKYLDGDMPDGS